MYVKELLNKLVLITFFLHIGKIKWTLVAEVDKSSKKNPKYEFEGQSSRSKKWFILEDNPRAT